MSAMTLSCIQAVRDCATGCVFERGFQLRFATLWLDKTQSYPSSPSGGGRGERQKSCRESACGCDPTMRWGANRYRRRRFG
jgi:hypothetical protein